MIKRVNTQDNLLVNIEEQYKLMVSDVIDNAKDVCNQFNYYTTKYRGDRLNDVNLGIYLDDSFKYIVQIYLNNGITEINSKLKLSVDLKRINKINTIMKEIFKMPVYANESFKERLDSKVQEIKSRWKDLEVVSITKSFPDSNGEMEVSVILKEVE